MRQIEKILSEIETCINQSSFKKLEHDKLELKDNSHSTSDWREVFKTCCAMLNTGGGIIIIGVFEDEKNKKFVATGYKKENEEKTKTIPKVFTNEAKQPFNLPTSRF